MRHTTFICIKHRFVRKRPGLCPTCREQLEDMGISFKPPRKNHDAQWEKLQYAKDRHQSYANCKTKADVKRRSFYKRVTGQ